MPVKKDDSNGEGERELKGNVVYKNLRMAQASHPTREERRMEGEKTEMRRKKKRGKLGNQKRKGESKK